MEFSLLHIRQFIRMHELIRRKATGDPRAFADRMGFSRATLFRNLEILRMWEAEIDYDRERMSYYYITPPDFSELKKLLASLNE